MSTSDNNNSFLTSAERRELSSVLQSKKETTERILRAKILLNLDKGISPIDIVKLMRIDMKSIFNVRARFEYLRCDALNDG